MYCLSGKIFDVVAIPEASSRVTLASLNSVFQTPNMMKYITRSCLNSLKMYCLSGKFDDVVVIPETSSRVTLASLNSVFQTPNMLKNI